MSNPDDKPDPHTQDQPTPERSEPRFRQDDVVITPFEKGRRQEMDGTIIVGSGTLSLYGDDGQLVDSVPVSNIPTNDAWRWINAAKLEWDDKLYRVVMYTGPASGMAALIANLRRCRALRKALDAERQRYPGPA